MQYALSFLAAIAVVKGSPFPQGVTQNVAPDGGMPAGCMANRASTFGIAVVAGTDMLAATQAADGQPAAATQIADGQPQAGVVNQINDGQVQAMTQIADGQIQAPMPTCAASQISDGQVQGMNCMMPTPAAQIPDGQVQASPTPAAPAASQISDGQIQANPTAPAATQIADGQPQAPAASQIADGQVQGDSSMSSGMTACMSEGTLMMTLMDGVLKDDQGRTGYIASNYQFQFDAPAQAGAIYTAGFSICEGGALALGPDKTFYRCRSGDFYNLYNENWAPQCEEVTIMAVDLVDC